MLLPARTRRARAMVAAAPLLLSPLASTACGDTPETFVVLDNAYPASAATPLVVYRAQWSAASFADPVLPGASSPPVSNVAASANTAYVLVAPGWDPASTPSPTSLVVLQSRAGFEVHMNQTLHIPVSDSAFAGDCASGSFLTQDQADFVTKLVFPSVFASATYDAATCTFTPPPPGDAGAD